MKRELFVGKPDVHKMESYPCFDWLRLVLALIVVIDHSGFNIAPFLTGGLAVKTFFALSGWLIGGILLTTKIDDLPRFFFNRATRIWIPYAAAIGLIYGTALLKEGIDIYWFKYLFLDLTFTHQLYTFFPAAASEMPMAGTGNHFWSIAVEEQFYLLAPLLMLFAPWGKSLKLWVPIAIICTLLGGGMASISLGVCAAIAQRDWSFAGRPSTSVASLIIASVCAMVISLRGHDHIVGPLFAISLVVLLASPGTRTRLGIVAGGISFPLYLNQWIAAFALGYLAKHGLALSPFAHIAVIIVLSIAVAFALYWMIDRPVLKYRSQWFTPDFGRQLGFTAYGLVALGIVGGGVLQLYPPT